MTELNKAVVELLIKATQTADSAEKFLTEQLPEVAQQYVTYRLMESGFWAAINTFVAAISIAVIYFLVKCVRKRHASGVYCDDIYCIGMIIAGFTAFASGWSALYKIDDVMLAYFAPKAMLLHWAAQLVK